VSLHLRSVRDEVGVVAVGIAAPAKSIGQFDLELVSGTDTDGVWQQTLHTSAGDVGAWALTSVDTLDKNGVWNHVPADELANISGNTWTTS
jgi:hypothetical protein